MIAELDYSSLKEINLGFPYANLEHAGVKFTIFEGEKYWYAVTPQNQRMNFHFCIPGENIEDCYRKAAEAIQSLDIAMMKGKITPKYIEFIDAYDLLRGWVNEEKEPEGSRYGFVCRDCKHEYIDANPERVKGYAYQHFHSVHGYKCTGEIPKS